MSKKNVKNYSSLVLNFSIFIITLFILFILVEVIAAQYYLLNYNPIKFQNLINLHDDTITLDLIRPDGSFDADNNPVYLNSAGFWDRNYSKSKPNDTVRIAIIGDSFTFGYGLDDYGKSYPKLLEKMLSANSDTRYEVINFGIPGMNALDIYWVLKYIVSDYDPDIVLYGYFNNDIEFLKQKRGGNIDIDFCNLFEHDNYGSYSYEFFKSRSDNIVISNMEGKRFGDFTTIYNLYDDNYYGWNCFKGISIAMKKLSTEDGFRLAIFFIPYEINAPDQSVFLHRKLRKLFSDESIIYLEDFTENFWDQSRVFNDSDLRIAPERNENHFNEKANRLIAKSLYDSLLSEKRLIVK